MIGKDYELMIMTNEQSVLKQSVPLMCPALYEHMLEGDTAFPNVKMVAIETE